MFICSYKSTVVLNKGHFYTDLASEMICKFCGKTFNRSFNLRRHENKYCPLKDQEREMSETESQTMDSEGDSSTSSTHGSESAVTTDNETETEDEENDPWMPMVEEAMQKYKTGLRK
jgi:hypothetical protein